MRFKGWAWGVCAMLACQGALAEEGAFDPIDEVVALAAAKMNQAALKAPPQTTPIRFERAQAQPGRRLVLIARVGSDDVAARDFAAGQGGGAGALLKASALRAVCGRAALRRLMSHGVVVDHVFLAPNGETLREVRASASDCAAYSIVAD